MNTGESLLVVIVFMVLWTHAPNADFSPSSGVLERYEIVNNLLMGKYQ
jgi:hypothetical protein